MDRQLFFFLEISTVSAIGIFITISFVFYFYEHRARWLLIAACFLWPFVVWHDTFRLEMLPRFAIPSAVSGLLGLAAAGWGVTIRKWRRPKLLFLPSGLAVKWSQKTGQLAKVYPKPLKGYENGEAPEFYRPV